MHLKQPAAQMGRLRLSVAAAAIAAAVPVAAQDIVPKEVVNLSNQALTIQTPTTNGSTNGAQSDANGFLACVANGHRGASIHEGNVEAATNLDRLSGSDGIVMVGHGWPGFVCTGYGDKCFSPLDRAWYFDDGNEPWRLDVKELRGGSGSSLRLLSCNSGAESSGSKLAEAIAGLTKRTVFAPRGLVWCRFEDGQITVDQQPDGQTWTVATPWKACCPGPLPLVDPPAEDIATFFIDGEQAGVTHPWAEFRIEDVEILLPPVEEERLVGGADGALSKWQKRAENEIAGALSRAGVPGGKFASGRFQVAPQFLEDGVDWAHPIVTSNVISALETFRLTFAIRVPGVTRGIRKAFRVLNGVILEDLETVGAKKPPVRVYYRLTKKFPRVRFPFLVEPAPGPGSIRKAVTKPR